MPLISPKKNQSENDFVSSCMSDPTMSQEYKDAKQRVAVCHSLFKQAKKRKSAKGESGNPAWGDNPGFLVLP